jgi:hypothetical protein
MPYVVFFCQKDYVDRNTNINKKIKKHYVMENPTHT